MDARDYFNLCTQMVLCFFVEADRRNGFLNGGQAIAVNIGVYPTQGLSHNYYRTDERTLLIQSTASNMKP